MNITCKQERREAALCCAVPCLYFPVACVYPNQFRSGVRRQQSESILPTIPLCWINCFRAVRFVTSVRCPCPRVLFFLLDIPPRLAGHDCSSQIILERISHIANSIRVSLSQIWRIQFAPHSYLSIVQRPRHKPHVSRVRVQVIDWHTLIDWSVRKLSQASPSPSSAQNGAL